jgi:hypothetical protein
MAWSRPVARERGSSRRRRGSEIVKKCCFQTSSIESRTFHLGVTLVGSGGIKREGAQEKTIAAWSEPSESGKEMVEKEKRNWSDHAALRFQRTRSRTVSFWLCSPARVATCGGERRERPLSSIQSSTESAQGTS